VEKVLVLKVVRDDMTSYNGFKWPESGKVVPERWTDGAECGNGLHGWLSGEGSYRHDFMEGKWIVFEADAKDVRWRGTEKVKVKEGNVIFCGSRTDAVKLLIERGALTEKSKPGTCCFTLAQLQELAYRATNRAKKHAADALRSTKKPNLIEHAEKIEAAKAVSDQSSASEARDILRNAAAAAYYAADAAAAADYAAYNAAYYAANAKTREEEEQRLDRLELLGFSVR